MELCMMPRRRTALAYALLLTKKATKNGGCSPFHTCHTVPRCSEVHCIAPCRLLGYRSSFPSPLALGWRFPLVCIRMRRSGTGRQDHMSARAGRHGRLTSCRGAPILAAGGWQMRREGCGGREAMYWVTLLGCLLLCLGCPMAIARSVKKLKRIFSPVFIDPPLPTQRLAFPLAMTHTQHA